MDTIEPVKPVAFARWADEDKKTEGGMLYGVESQGIPVWLKCREDSFMFGWERAMLHPGAGPENAQLLLVCPKCGQQLRISGPHKTFEWENVDPPRRLNVPGNPDVVNVARITIVEDMGCPQCGQQFRLTGNVLSKVLR